MRIHHTAHIESSAELGTDVEVGPDVYIGPRVLVGDNCVIRHGAHVTGCTTMGQNNIVYPYAVLGTPPQDMKYHGESTRLIIGNDNVFREYVTVNVGTPTGRGTTEVGDRNFFMINSHLGHDSVVEDDTVLVNSVLVGGHCRLEAGAKLQGAAAVNPFVTIGRMSYVGGLSRIVQDVPPFMIVEGNPAHVRRVNGVGLERAGYSQECIGELREAYKAIYRSKQLNRLKIFDHIEEQGAACEEVRYLIAFLRRSLEGRHGRHLEGQRKA